LTNPTRIKLLKKYFDVVIHLPYLTKTKRYNENIKLIRVSAKTKQALNNLKIVPNETYDHIIGRLLEGIKE